MGAESKVIGDPSNSREHNLDPLGNRISVGRRCIRHMGLLSVAKVKCFCSVLIRGDSDTLLVINRLISVMRG